MEVLEVLDFLAIGHVMLAESTHFGNQVAHGPRIDLPLLFALICVMLPQVLVRLERRHDNHVDVDDPQMAHMNENRYVFCKH